MLFRSPVSYIKIIILVGCPSAEGLISSPRALTSCPSRADRLWAQEREYMVAKIVDLYICEQFGHLLVTVGQFANPIAEYGLHKMLRSRCFATIIQRPISRTAHCSRNATLSYRLHWNECAQLTLISARDFNVTDASRTMRARF